MVEIEKKRGTLLTIWLALILIANFFGALYYLIFDASIASFYPNVSSWIFYIFGLACLANFVFVIFLFMWKKWAFFAFCGSAAVAFIMNLAIGLGIGTAIAGFAGPIILYWIMRSKWSLFG